MIQSDTDESITIVTYLIMNCFSLDVPPRPPESPPSCKAPNVRHAGTGIGTKEDGRRVASGAHVNHRVSGDATLARYNQHRLGLMGLRGGAEDGAGGSARADRMRRMPMRSIRLRRRWH
jgi:hypothetical protein